MVHTELSDLFFNHEHPTREAYMVGTDPEYRTDAEVEATIRTDAADFLRCYPNVAALFDSPTPDALAADFLKRV